MAAFSSIDRAKISIGVLLRGILAIVFLSSLIPAHALAERIPAYMSLEGENQGRIEGGSTEKGHEGEIVVYAINHNVHIPRDPNSGLPSGNRIHAPLSVVKEIDASTPKLYKALVTGEHLKNVRIKFYKIDKTGTEMHYYSIDLQDAIIVDIKTWSPISFLPENEPYRDMEEVSFVYRKIVWTYEEGGIESEDSWKAPFTLSVQKTGIGTGTVTSDDGRINCGASCSDSYSAGTRVTLQAVPYTGSVFIGWTGAGCSGTGTCVIDLRTNTTVQAAFSLADPGCFTYDSDCDGDVDIVDVMLVASRWNTSLGDPNYDAKYDIDNDGDIDIVDVMLVAAQWGWKQ